jgi:hypothetical protein
MLVTVAIATILVGVIFVVFETYSRQVQENLALNRLQRQYDNVADIIGFNVRAASTVVQHGGGSETEMVSGVDLLDGEGNLLNSFMILDNALYEYDLDAAANKLLYVDGTDPVGIDGTQSGFTLTGGNTELELKLVLTSGGSDPEYTLSPRKDVFVCRN